MSGFETGPGAPEAAWMATDAVKAFALETRRLPGTALRALAKMLDGVADSLEELQANTARIATERDQNVQLYRTAADRAAEFSELLQVERAKVRRLRREASARDRKKRPASRKR